MELYPEPMTQPAACGPALAGCRTPPEQIEALLEAGRKYRSFKHWARIRIGKAETPITGQGFNCVKFDPAKPARTIRRNDGNLGMHGAMHWAERRRFSLPEMKRFGSFPDGFQFAGTFEEGIRQVGNSVPPLFMKAIAAKVGKLISEVRR